MVRKQLKDIKILSSEIRKIESEIVRLNSKITHKANDEVLRNQKQADLIFKKNKLKKLIKNIDEAEVKYVLGSKKIF